MDKTGTKPMIDQLNSLGGFPMIQDDWDSSDFHLEDALVHIRDWNFHPITAVGTDADIYNTSRKILYVIMCSVCVILNQFCSISSLQNNIMHKFTYLRGLPTRFFKRLKISIFKDYIGDRTKF